MNKQEMMGVDKKGSDRKDRKEEKERVGGWVGGGGGPTRAYDLSFLVLLIR